MSKNTKLYQDLKNTLIEWSEVGRENSRMSALFQNVISGGPDLSDDRREQENLRQQAITLTRQLIKNGARLSKILEVQKAYAYNDHGGLEIVKEEMEWLEYERA